MQDHDTIRHNKNTKTLAIIFGVVFCMVGVSFASVPLYNLFCRVTGFGGTTQVSSGAPDTILDRRITVQFDTNVNSRLPWRFEANQGDVTVNVGQDALVSFTAYNEGGVPVAGTAVYNVTPMKVGKYFQKTQCFCFDRQILRPGQSMNMPVVFYVDPAIADDPDMKDIEVITLSYSFFKADSSELDRAMETFYNAPE